MQDFEFWQRWGMELDDAAFARALVALGIASSAAPDGRKRKLVDWRTISDPLERGLLEAEIKLLVTGQLSASRRHDAVVAWQLPEAAATLRAGRLDLVVESLRPSDWAEIWPQVAEATGVTPRLRVKEFPRNELIRPWFRLLAEAKPQIAAAHIEWDAPRAQPVWKWPLRIGYLGGSGDAALCEDLHGRWPASELATIHAVGRANANCDVLVVTADTRQLLRSLLEFPGSIKTNLIVVRGRFEEDAAGTETRLKAIAAETHASGLVFVHAEATDQQLTEGLRRLVEELSHNAPLDVALTRSLIRDRALDAVPFLSAAAARLKLEQSIDEFRARLKAMPPGTRVRADTGVLVRTGVLPDNFSGDGDDPATLATSLDLRRADLSYEHEYGAGTGLARVGAAIEAAEPPPEVQATRVQRFLQQQAFLKSRGEMQRVSTGFRVGTPVLLRVRVGPPDDAWQSAPTSLPEQDLPRDRERWRLTVVLTELNQLPRAMRKTIVLPTDGPSSECEFLFRPRQAGPFEGRLTILHRGRVLQTALLTATVVSAEEPLPIEGRVELKDLVRVRENISDLRQRSQFDLAFVLNETTSGQPRISGVSRDHAWIADTTSAIATSGEINVELSKVAKSVKDYAGGLDAPRNTALIIKLAQLGRYLQLYLVENQLGAPGNRRDLAERGYVQVVTTRSEAMVPLEFIYDYETPDDNATLCPKWREALEMAAQPVDHEKLERCFGDCDTTSGAHVCPLGFWGLSRVIERHALAPHLATLGHELMLQSEPAQDRATLKLGGVAVTGHSDRVKDDEFAPVLQAVKAALGADPCTAGDWDNWAKLVEDYKPSLLIALPHTDGHGSSSSLELGGVTIKTIQIKAKHVRPAADGPRPVVLLLGCDTKGTAQEYADHVAVFRGRGAAVVIGTIATVFGGHAAQVARQLVEGLAQSDGVLPERLGQLIKAIKCRALLDSLPMALCVVAFGDADWKLRS